MLEDHDESKTTVGKPASLLDKWAMGGIFGSKGFDFQKRYALILLIESLADPHFKAMLVEGAEDVEIRFESDTLGAVHRRAIQVKDHLVKTTEAMEIIDRFDKLNKDSLNTWSSFVIACCGLDGKLSTIYNKLERYRSICKGEFYKEENGILFNTRAELIDILYEVKLPVEFVIEQVAFEPNLILYHDHDLVISRAKDLLHGLYPEIDQDGLENLSLRVDDLVKKFTGKPIFRQQVEELIKIELDKYAKKSVEPDQIVIELLELFSKHAAFIKMDRSGGDPTVMFEAVRRTRTAMGDKSKSMFMLSKDPVAERFRGIQYALSILEGDTWEKYPEVAALADDQDIVQLKKPERKEKVRALLGKKMSDDACNFLGDRAYQVRESVQELVADLKKMSK